MKSTASNNNTQYKLNINNASSNNPFFDDNGKMPISYSFNVVVVVVVHQKTKKYNVRISTTTITKTTEATTS